MSGAASGGVTRPATRAGGTLYKKEFWQQENLNYGLPHLRMEKVARLVNSLARGEERTLLDVGCGPATLNSLLQPSIKYYGIDIAVQQPAPNLLEADLVQMPIKFDDRRFDMVVAHGFFEYVGNHRSERFAEIADLLDDGGVFITSYVNFNHRHREVHWPYSNMQPFKEFRASPARNFSIKRCFPTSYNWNHWEPSQKVVRSVNMKINVSIPVIASVLAVQYLMICSARSRSGAGARA